MEPKNPRSTARPGSVQPIGTPSTYPRIVRDLVQPASLGSLLLHMLVDAFLPPMLVGLARKQKQERKTMFLLCSAPPPNTKREWRFSFEYFYLFNPPPPPRLLVVSWVCLKVVPTPQAHYPTRAEEMALDVYMTNDRSRQSDRRGNTHNATNDAQRSADKTRKYTRCMHSGRRRWFEGEAVLQQLCTSVK